MVNSPRKVPASRIPRSGSRALELDRFLPYRLSVLSNTVSTAIAGAYQQRFGLSVPEWRVMAVIARTPGLSAATVAERTAMDKVAVSRAVGSLLEKGHLERATSAADRRRSALTLSRAGLRVYEQVVPVALAYERALLDGLDAPARQALNELLEALLERAHRLGPADDVSRR
jgi:DNA-binding MarR family transcriptional regulator